MARADDPAQLAALAMLEEPTRRRLYDFIVAQARPVSREEAATAVAIDRSLAAYHLDALVDGGLLVASFARTHGRRGGPGAGRPAKHYERTPVEFAASLPPREYQLAAEILARAAEHHPQGMSAAIEATARARGHELATSTDAATLTELLDSHGFAPYVDSDDVVRLANCPFHRLATEHVEVICGMNLALLQGLLDGAGIDDRRATLEPEPGRCCVAFPPARAD